MSQFLSNLLSVGMQVSVIFLLIGMGALTRWTRTMDDASIRGATSLLLNFVTPCLLVATFQRDCSTEQLRAVGLSAAIGFGFHAASMALAYLFVHDPDRSRDAVLKFAVIFTNAGFMSLPLQKELLGEDGVFCGAVIVGVFQVLCWTYGIWLMGGRDARFSPSRIFLNPGITGIAIAMAFFLTGLRLPEALDKPCRMMGELNTPLAMVVIGYHLAGSRVAGVLRDRRALWAMALRLAVSPAVTLLVLAAFGKWDRTLLLAAMIAASAPTAAITTILAVQYRRDVTLSVELVSVTTLASVATMPLLVALAETFCAR